MRVKQILSLLFIVAASLLLVACSTIPSSQPAALAAPVSQEEVPVSPLPTEFNLGADSTDTLQQFWVEEVPRVDEQGAVIVEITPLNLNNPGSTIDFQVSLNTHSVDLSMDLAALSTLKTDTGYFVQASQWDAPVGGHHVSGKLSFPAAVDGVPLLSDATKLVLTMVNLDTPERVFVWEK